jgi:mannose-6-phosphate isomerase-like protein (cupin superfamily)
MSINQGGIILGAGEGKTIAVLGEAYTYKAAREETGGAYALIEHTVGGDGPPPHIHTTEEEAFYVLEGALNVLVGERTVTATAGAFVLVPRGTVHTFSNGGPAPAKVLVIISPAGFEQFFEEIAGPPDLEKIRALAPKYHLEIVGRHRSRVCPKVTVTCKVTVTWARWLLSCCESHLVAVRVLELKKLDA